MDAKYIDQRFRRVLKRRLFIITLSIASIAFVAGTECTHAEPDTDNHSDLIVEWKEGSRVRKLMLQSGLVADFGGGVSALSEGSEKVIQSGKVTIWRVLGGNFADSAKKSRGKFSPVFRDQSGKFRALPGNIIVTFSDGMSDADVRNWAKKRGLRILRRLLKTRNIYVIESEPGMASLELSNSLNDDAQVESCTPNWWIERRQR